MVTAMWCLHWVEVLFPEFEFNWLGEEMQQNLPLELDFRHEAGNATRARADFAHHRHTSLYIPEVYNATKRTMVMEFIEGRRVEDLEYLRNREQPAVTFCLVRWPKVLPRPDHIDRNAVSRELSRIFSEMVYINGCTLFLSHHSGFTHPKLTWQMVISLSRRSPCRESPHSARTTWFTELV